MSNQLGARRRQTTAALADRQLTLGECLAIARYGPSYLEGEPERVRLDALLRTIDAMAVCTTCGWSVHTHQGDALTRRVVHCCAHYTRDL